MSYLPARADDPATSWEAAERNEKSGKTRQQQNVTAQAVADRPGLTSAELSKVTGLCRYMLARRLPEVERQGRVKRGDVRVCSATGYKAATWTPEVSTMPLVRIERSSFGSVFAIFTMPSRPGYEYDPQVLCAEQVPELLTHIKQKTWITPRHIEQFVRLMEGEFGEGVAG